MSKVKTLGKKVKLIALRRRSAPRWADIKKFGLKRARTRRINVRNKNWRESRNKV